MDSSAAVVENGPDYQTEAGLDRGLFDVHEHAVLGCLAAVMGRVAEDPDDLEDSEKNIL